jgi:predicted metal-dependent phosphoesterase TrpH
VLIDLHAHSVASDGTDTPAAVIEAAAEAGLDVVALTDHDSTSGWVQAEAAARRLGVGFVPGLELSCRAVAGISVHLLAYLPDPDDPALTDALDRIRDDRVWRARRMVERIAVDYELSWDDVAAQVGDGATVGRPHLADALVARGHVADRDEAFGRILGRGSPYHVPHYAPDVVAAVRLVGAAGGVAVMAHPLAARRGRVVPDSTIAEMAGAGLAGLEVDHRDHLPGERTHLRGLAAELGLLVTGASDYHGSGKPNRLGENRTDPVVLDAVLAAGTGARAVLPQR